MVGPSLGIPFPLAYTDADELLAHDAEAQARGENGAGNDFEDLECM